MPTDIELLTDQAPLSVPVTRTFLLHVVDTEDDSQDPAGSSYKAEARELTPAILPVQESASDPIGTIRKDECIIRTLDGVQYIFRWNAATGTSSNFATELAAGNWVCQGILKSYVDTGLALKANLAGATFTGNVVVPQIASTVQALTLTSNAATWNCNSGSIATVTTDSATAVITMTNFVSGTDYKLRVTQGATSRNIQFVGSTLTFLQIGGGGDTVVGATASTISEIIISLVGTTAIIYPQPIVG